MAKRSAAGMAKPAQLSKRKKSTSTTPVDISKIMAEKGKKILQ